MEEFWSIADHAGAPYSQLVGQIHLHLKPKSYLETGIETGSTLTLTDCLSIAVDPHFQISRNITGGEPLCCLFQMKSDDFFQRYNPQAIVGPIGLAFLDGMHLFEYTLRDFIYTERYAAPNSVILLHDCIPTDALGSRRPSTRRPATSPDEALRVLEGLALPPAAPSATVRI